MPGKQEEKMWKQFKQSAMGTADAASPSKHLLSESEDDEKENHPSRDAPYRSNVLVESSDEEFDLYLKERVTPKVKGRSKNPSSAVKKDRSQSSIAVFLSSDSDDGFEAFVNRMKTPKSKPRRTPESNSEDSLKHFLVDDFSSDDDFVQTKPSARVNKKTTTPAAPLPPVRKPLSEWDSPVFLSDDGDDDECGIVIKSTWRTRHTKPKPAKLSTMVSSPDYDEDDSQPSSPSLCISSGPPKSIHSTHRSTSLSSEPPKSIHSTHRPTNLSSDPPKITHSAPSKLDDCSSSSDEEFLSLLDRLKRKTAKLSSTASPKHHNTGDMTTPQSHKWPISLDLNPGSLMKPPSSVPPGKGQAPLNVKTPAGTPGLLVKGRKAPVSLTPGQTPLNVVKKTPVPPVKGQRAPPKSRSLGEMPPHVNTPGQSAVYNKPTISQTEPRAGPVSRVPVCRTPGCFLQSLSEPGSNYGRYFKQNKEELTSRLYRLYNTSVFDDKLPADMSVTWNKKLRKTAGYCISGQHRAPTGSRYARIELSDKVCDSADRLRDTLVHEMCHAATWMNHGIRDGHGSIWQIYARKATLAHPELPMVTRCHSYDITYKFQYQCVRCKNIIGRHSKSLDTERFACAICKGTFVLLNAASQRPATPFANFVKENFASVRQRMAGQSHGEVMRKLSEEFAAKARLSQS